MESSYHKTGKWKTKQWLMELGCDQVQTEVRCDYNGFVNGNFAPFDVVGYKNHIIVAAIEVGSLSTKLYGHYKFPILSLPYGIFGNINLQRLTSLNKYQFLEEVSYE